MSNDWRPVTRQHPCPVCGKPDWCMVKHDGTAVLCNRIDEGSKVQAPAGGWIHEMNDTAMLRNLPPKRPSRPVLDFSEMAAQLEYELLDHERQQLADELGVTVDSLWQLGVGRYRSGTFSFPMRNGYGKVIGIRLRTMQGKKFSVVGSREGAFIPRRRYAGPLYVAEGPTDTLALLSLGLDGIGRSSCHGSVRIVCHVAKRYGSQEVVVIADTDDPGVEGANAAANALGHVAEVRIIRPLIGKDIRDWVRAGATADVVRSVVNNTQPMGATDNVESHT